MLTAGVPWDTQLATVAVDSSLILCSSSRVFALFLFLSLLQFRSSAVITKLSVSDDDNCGCDVGPG